MDNMRNMVLFAILTVAVLFGWPLVSGHFFPTANPPATRIVDGKSVPVPNPAADPAADSPAALRDRAVVLADSPRVLIDTPRLQGSINLRGARIDDLVLRTYRETIAKDSPPIRLLSPAGAGDAYFAGFGWTGSGAALPTADTVWTASGTRLAPNSPVTLTWSNPTGQRFAIRLSVDPNYMFTVEQSVTNGGGGAISARPWSLVSRVGHSKDPTAWTNHVGPMGVFDGKANYSVDFKDLDKTPAGERFTTTGGWAGFTDKYWLTAVIPDQSTPVEAGFRGGPGNSYQADFTTAPAIVAPGATVRSVSRLFAGAKEVNLLDGYEDNLGIARFGKAIDWGWFEIVEKPIFDILDWLFRTTGNFGVAIILLTCLVRGLMFPVAQKQFKSMAAMRVLQPKMKALQEKHKDDKAKLQQEMLAMYQKEKVNPVAGCLPILLQIPIFYALYKVLMLTIEMRHQPFALWIKDLSAPDPMTPVNLFGLLPFTPPHMIAIGVLPILLGITMYLQFKLNPQPMDPMQKQVFSIMPWIFMFIMAPFAAGLQLYWTVSNLLTIAQQKFLYSRYPGMPAADAK
ncbi:membrane protein insertase YidC [Sphingomonas solaris]|uniref:Membrane protein insertase YidC n=1 Tax=Alterirhizorhabdus solaris TaxID=2529389 RepID=A0A558QZN0_9SPHN|nr:membrane protein insertase YidC [Sphingomonas solaris]TVV72591.1 membrane protein insertase YidC [Sphingomonas solaris]